MKKQEFIVSISIKQTNILLAEDNSAFRKSLKLLVEQERDIKVVGEAKSGCEAVRLTQSLRPDVVVMDIAMPLLNGLEATRQIMKSYPNSRVLILSAHPDSEYIERAMLFGASGYLIKQSSTQFLAKAIREVFKGNTYFSTSIPRQLRDECRIVFDKGELLKKKLARVGKHPMTSARFLHPDLGL